MLTIQIDNVELEKSIKQIYGDDDYSIANAFYEFIQKTKIKQDIGISIKQLEAGKSIPMQKVISDIRSQYE